MTDFRRLAAIAIAAQIAWAAPAQAALLSSSENNALFDAAKGSFEWLFEGDAGLAASEPETWMMLLGGFGLIGSTFRRRSRSSDRRQLV